MQNGVARLEFNFDNSADKLVSSLQYMLDHIAGSLPQQADAEDILFRSKVIITELLTNAIKHAGKGATLMQIETDENRLLISKTDNGMPLYLINTRNNASAQVEAANKRLISADMLNSLYAIWETENHIRFSSEEGSLDDFLSVEEVMEHFGILIITRSSDEFTYTYDRDSRSNIFKVLITF
jgi:anti-sigma regulatory factor (Ser/Thr protein kinase)